MINNDFVAMEQNICPVCGITHEYNTGVLLHKNLKTIPDDKRVTGYGLCEEHDKLFQDGYIALVVTDESKSTVNDKGNMDMQDAHRTGALIHVRRELFNDLLKTELPETQEMVFIDEELAEKLSLLQEQNA